MNNQMQMVETQQQGEALRMAWYTFIIFCLLCVDFYHVFNYQYQSMTSTGFFDGVFDFFLAFAIATLAFALKPATIMFTNSHRLKDNFLTRAATTALLITLIYGIFIATVSSMNTNTEVRGRDVTTHDSSLVALELQERSAKSKLELTLLTAKSETPERAALIKSSAELSYNRKMEEIAERRTQASSQAPLKQAHDAGVFAVSDSLRNAVFSLFITLAGVGVTVFMCLHIKSETRIPAFSLAPNINQAWESRKENFRSENFRVNPLKGIFSGMFFGHKQDVVSKEHRLNDPTVINGTATPSDQPQPKKKRPATSQEDELSFTFGGVTYTLSELKECRAIYNIRGCPVVFVSVTGNKGYLMLIPSPNESEWIYKRLTDDAELLSKLTKSKHPRSEFSAAVNKWHELNDTKPAQQGNSEEIMGNPHNSPELPLNNQEDKDEGKSQEIKGNTGTTGEMSDISPETRILDLSHICENSSIEQKLQTLSNTIDELSKDKSNHGIFCSPTKAFEVIPGRYDYVSDLFKEKLTQGKLAKKGNRYIINYTGPA